MRLVEHRGGQSVERHGVPAAGAPRTELRWRPKIRERATHPAAEAAPATSAAVMPSGALRRILVAAPANPVVEVRYQAVTSICCCSPWCFSNCASHLFCWQSEGGLPASCVTLSNALHISHVLLLSMENSQLALDVARKIRGVFVCAAGGTEASNLLGELATDGAPGEVC